MASAASRQSVYARAPLGESDGISLFCPDTDLTRNYDAVYEDVFKQIDAGRDPNDAPIFRQFEEADVKLIRDHSEGGRILDGGVAMGRILGQLPDSYEKFGFDISVACLRRAKARGIEVCRALVEDLPYREGAFDLALCTDFFEHVFDLNAAIGAILRTLRPGGLLFVRVPWREDLAKYLSHDFPYPYHHLRNFDEHNLRLLFERVFGCRVVEHRLVGYEIAAERRHSRLPFAGRMTRLAKALHPPLGERLLRRFFLAHEIEVVVERRA